METKEEKVTKKASEIRSREKDEERLEKDQKVKCQRERMREKR